MCFLRVLAAAVSPSEVLQRLGGRGVKPSESSSSSPQPIAIRLRAEVDKRALGIGHDTGRLTLGGVLGLGNQSSTGLGHAEGSSAIKAWGGWAPP